jgi:hypothetical protein
MHMQLKLGHVVAAAAVAGFLAGGIGLASAQEDPSSTTTTAPSATDDQPSTPAPDDTGCDHDRGSSDSGSTDGSSTSSSSTNL